ncbi:MAG TPA: heme-binding protein [Steroidobacteraceae bacterium]|jgi:uncharacterized protein GlcG (DUF336 family)|nr:heme-binding protein [Steroidobacteraceae bacterium]
MRVLTVVAAALLATACGGSGPAINSNGTAPAGCLGACATASTFLSVDDVQQVIAQAVGEAQARKAAATIAVVDRVGNVLAVYRMNAPASSTILIASNATSPVNTGLDGIRLPISTGIDALAAIAKAVTGSYLSSEGNAFSTRTASQIVQQHFNPGTSGSPSGPLFGVQFSQLACSDLNQQSDGTATQPGPQRSPLGLSADPGGFPLYKAGTVVGGVGVIADGHYGIDADIESHAVDLDEAIAMAATYNYGAPVDRRADEITAGGISLHYTNIEYANLSAAPATAPAYTALGVATGALLPVGGYWDGNIRVGTAFGQPASGIAPDNSGNFANMNAFALVDAANNPRFPLQAGTDGANALTKAEVLQLLQSALKVANAARGQIRLPLGATARVSISVVDTLGVPLGFVRSQDAPIFGADVSLQKARTVAFLSSADAAGFLNSLPPAQYPVTDGTGSVFAGAQVTLGSYATAAQTFLADPTALTDGTIAYSDRAMALLARPFFPDGIDGTANGPFSKPLAQWSVFSDGLQLDLANNAILQHVLHEAGVLTNDVVPGGCAGVSLILSPPPPANIIATATAPAVDHRLGNGLQIFAGSVPIYRGATLVGAIGVSGDGTQQDDMVAFLGLSNASKALSGSINQAPANRRADTLAPQGSRLLYVQCPQSPFLNSDQENVCNAL